MRSNIGGLEIGTLPSGVSQENFLKIGSTTVYLKTPSQVKIATEKRNGFTLVHFDIIGKGDKIYEIVIETPFLDIQKSWAGQVQTWTGSEFVSVALNFSYDTASNRFVPVICNYALNGENRLLVGLADHKPLTRVTQAVLVEHPMRNIRLTFSRKRPNGPFRETLILGFQREDWSEIAQRHFQLCKTLAHIDPLPAHTWAHNPVWCSWYACVTDHTQADIKKELPALQEVALRPVRFFR